MIFILFIATINMLLPYMTGQIVICYFTSMMSGDRLRYYGGLPNFGGIVAIGSYSTAPTIGMLVPIPRSN